ncbi:MAG: PqqD family peptide modification chaperone [Vicinamibacterales bacterium]
MSDDLFLCLHDSVIWRDLGGVLIVLNGKSGRYFQLDGSAAEIWRQIDGRRTAAAVARALAGEHDGAAAAIERDVREFVDGALADHLLVARQEPASRQDAQPGLDPALQIGASGLTVNGSLDALREQFARNHYVQLAQFIDARLLSAILDRVAEGEFIDRSHGHIGTEECLEPGLATSMLQLAFNDPALLAAIEEIAGCGPVRCFDGRVYRMTPGAGHYDSWHGDVGQDRQVAVSVNLSVEPYDGGQLEIRRVSETQASHTVSNQGLGNAVMFRVSPELRHRVGPVEGAHARMAYAGWFRSMPDFQDLFFATLRQ